MSEYLNETLDMYKRQAERELADLCKGSIDMRARYVAEVQRRHIERCEPVFVEMARLENLKTSISITVNDPEVATRIIAAQTGLPESALLTGKHRSSPAK